MPKRSERDAVVSDLVSRPQSHCFGDISLWHVELQDILGHARGCVDGRSTSSTSRGIALESGLRDLSY